MVLETLHGASVRPKGVSDDWQVDSGLHYPPELSSASVWGSPWAEPEYLLDLH